MSRPLFAAFLAMALPTIAGAEVPRVVTDIPPVQSLAAQVMGDLGQPALVVRPGASPHGYAMKPSEAAALGEAQAVFLVGPQLTPWLIKPVATLAPEAARIELLTAPGTLTLPTRTGATFAPHDHGADDEAPEDHAHDDHGAEDHAHDYHGHHDHGHDDHGNDDHAHDDHGHDDDAHEAGSIDPHAWLDPENGKAWLAVIAAELSRLDPENAATYAANASAGAAAIDAASADAGQQIAALGPLRFVAFHDAYQYLENRFGISAAGAVSLSDASTPSPARIAELRGAVARMGATCALSEPQFNSELLKTVFAGTEVKTAVIDPLGTGIEPGPDFYPALIRSFGTALAACR